MLRPSWAHWELRIGKFSAFFCTHFEAIMFTMAHGTRDNATRSYSLFVLISGNALVNYLFGSRERREGERALALFRDRAVCRGEAKLWFTYSAASTGSNYSEKWRRKRYILIKRHRRERCSVANSSFWNLIKNTRSNGFYLKHDGIIKIKKPPTAVE